MNFASVTVPVIGFLEPEKEASLPQVAQHQYFALWWREQLLPKHQNPSDGPPICAGGQAKERPKAGACQEGTGLSTRALPCWCLLEAGGSGPSTPREAPTSGPSTCERAFLEAARAVVPSTHLAHVPHLLGVHPAITAECLCRGERKVRARRVSGAR